MKTTCFYIIIALLAIVSCNQNEKKVQEKVSFEIYETLSKTEVPINLVEQLQQPNIELNTDTLSPIMAFAPVSSTMQFSKIFDDNARFLQTIYPVDKSNKYVAIVAAKRQPYLNISDVKNTKPLQNRVEIYFNLQGTNKWAELTKNNIGKLVAFSINQKIYTLTTINGQIKNGIAVINGFENEDIATMVSESINSGL